MPCQSTGNGHDGGGLFVCLSFARVMMLLVGWLAKFWLLRIERMFAISQTLSISQKVFG